MALLCEFTLFNGTVCQVPDIFCASTSTYTRNKVTINMALTFMICDDTFSKSQLYNCLLFGIRATELDFRGYWRKRSYYYYYYYYYYSYCKLYMPDMLHFTKTCKIKQHID